MRKTSLENNQRRKNHDDLSLFLFQTPTQEVVKKARHNPKWAMGVVAVAVIGEESNQYRSKRNARGEITHASLPRIEAKLLALIGDDLTMEYDFLGRPVRTKESDAQRKIIVKVSEIIELRIMLDTWFSKKGKADKEIEELTETLTLLNEFSGAQVLGLLIETTGMTQYIQNLQKRKQTVEENLKKIIKEKQRLEYELISEVVDLYYNLTHLMYLDSENIPLYEGLFVELNETLGFTTPEALSLTLAKFHTRIYRSKGKNNDSEYDAIRECFIENKINFPTNEQLKKLFKFTTQMRKNLTQHYQTLKDNFPAFKAKQFEIAKRKVITRYSGATVLEKHSLKPIYSSFSK